MQENMDQPKTGTCPLSSAYHVRPAPSRVVMQTQYHILRHADPELDHSVRIMTTLHVIGPLFLVDTPLRQNALNTTTHQRLSYWLYFAIRHKHTAGRVPGSLNVPPLDKVFEHLGMSLVLIENRDLTTNPVRKQNPASHSD